MDPNCIDLGPYSPSASHGKAYGVGLSTIRAAFSPPFRNVTYEKVYREKRGWHLELIEDPRLVAQAFSHTKKTSI